MTFEMDDFGSDPVDDVDFTEGSGLYIAYNAKSLDAAAQDPKTKPKIVGYGLEDEAAGFFYFPNGKQMKRYDSLGAATAALEKAKTALKPTDVDFPDKVELAIRFQLNVALYMKLNGVGKPEAEKVVKRMQLDESVAAIREGYASLDDALLAQAWPRIRPVLQAAFRGLDAWSTQKDRVRAARISDKLAAEVDPDYKPETKRKLFGRR